MESGIEGLELSDNVNYDRVCDLFITRKTLADARSGARLMTTKELAESLGVSVETVRTAARKLIDPSKSIWKVVNGGKSQVFDVAQATAIKIELQNRSGLVNIRETAKELNVKVKVLVVWLIGHGWCFRGKHCEIVATAEAVRRKLMAIRECESHGKVFQQSLITAKGRAKLALVIKNEIGIGL